jgi:hypothetical protein
MYLQAKIELGDFKNLDRMSQNLSKPPVTQEKLPVISFLSRRSNLFSFIPHCNASIQDITARVHITMKERV